MTSDMEGNDAAALTAGYQPLSSDSLLLETPPSRREVVRAGSRWPSVLVLIGGLCASGVIVIGGLLVMILGGMGTAERAAQTLQSSGLKAVCVIAVVAGVVTMLTGGVVYRLMGTRVARSQVLGGIILGAQGAVLAAAVLYFVQGDMKTFTRNFVNFPNVIDWLHYFGSGIKNTIILTFASTLFGIMVGLAFSVFLISEWRIVRGPVRVFVNIMRGTPILLQLAIVYYGLALGLRVNWSAQTALIVTLGLNASAYMAEVFRAGLQSIEKAQMDAARGLGLSYGKSLRYVVVPQAVRRVIPPLMNDFIQITKDTSLIAFLGVALNGRELYTVASDGYGEFFNSTFFVAAGLGYLAITLPMIGIVNAIERRIRSGLVSVSG